MEIKVNNEGKTVQIWLSSSEKRNDALIRSLKPMFKEYSDKKYLTAVFESGDGDLFEGTRDLLLINRINPT